MSFRSVTTTLSSLRTTTCDALIVPSINIFHVISITSVNKTLKHAGKTFTKLYYRVILITNEIFVKMKVYHTIPLNPTLYLRNIGYIVISKCTQLHTFFLASENIG